MAVEPLPSRFDLPTPDADDGDVIAVGGDLSPGLVLQAYRKGLFPMNLPDGRLGWWSPVDRATIARGGLRISRSLEKSTRRFQVSVDVAFDEVITRCATLERPGAWITEEFIEVYGELHRLGWAHSVEVWDQAGGLVGGLYGVNVGGLFAGESMFHLQRDASKVALVHLMVIMSSASACLVDVQWQTEHLAGLGAEVIGRDAYLASLREALSVPSPFPGSSPTAPM